jgi:hypothetical protein
MRRWKFAVLVGVVMMAACEKSAPPPPKTDFEAFERKYIAEYRELAKALRADGRTIPEKDVPKSYRGVYIGASGVWIDRAKVAELADVANAAKRTELVAAIDANARLLPTVGYSGAVAVFDLDTQASSVAVSALQLFAGKKTHFMIRREDPEVAFRATMPICETTLRDTTNKIVDGEVQVNLSVLVQKDRTWVAISRIDEFQEIPRRESHDYEKIENTLKEHKATAFFADRNDMELAVSQGTAYEVMMLLNIACDVGFVDVAVVTEDKLSAVPSL